MNMRASLVFVGIQTTFGGEHPHMNKHYNIYIYIYICIYIYLSGVNIEGGRVVCLDSDPHTRSQSNRAHLSAGAEELLVGEIQPGFGGVVVTNRASICSSAPGKITICPVVIDSPLKPWKVSPKWGEPWQMGPRTEKNNSRSWVGGSILTGHSSNLLQKEKADTSKLPFKLRGVGLNTNGY